MTTSIVYKTKNGASREQLFDAERLTTQISFILEDGRIIWAFVDEVTAEDPRSKDRQTWILKLFDPHAILGSNILHGFLNTKTREGHLQTLEASLAA